MYSKEEVSIVHYFLYGNAIPYTYGISCLRNQDRQNETVSMRQEWNVDEIVLFGTQFPLFISNLVVFVHLTKATEILNLIKYFIIISIWVQKGSVERDCNRWRNRCAIHLRWNLRSIGQMIAIKLNPEAMCINISDYFLKIHSQLSRLFFFLPSFKSVCMYVCI